MASLDQPAHIGYLQLETPLLAASSSATARLEDLQKLNRTAIGAIILKSGTVLEREGNPETNYYSDGILTVNAKGLPGPDIDGTMKMLDKFNPERRKPLILSLAGMRSHEYSEMIRATRRAIGKTFDGYELNLSCPNVAGKPIISYDPETTEAIVESILTNYQGILLGVKIAPFFSESDQNNLKEKIQAHLDKSNPGWRVELNNPICHGLDELAALIHAFNRLQSKGLEFVSATNTFPNCRITDQDGKSIINQNTNGGRAGLSGHFLHELSVSNVATLRRRLHPNISIIGTGGVKDGQTANDFFQAGADAVAIGSELVEKGPKVVQQILLS